MPSETSRPWAYIGLGAAALFAVGSVVALNIATEQRRAEAETAGSSTAQLEQRYAAAASEIDAWEATQRQSSCELDARIVWGVRIEERMVSSLDRATVVSGAYLILNPGDRSAFEASRLEAVETFATGFTTDDDAAVAAEYEGVDDVVAECLAEPAPTTAPLATVVTLADVEELEARAAALDTTGPDTARLDELDAAVAGFGPAVLQAADAVVNVNRLAATQEALAAAAEPLREQSAPLQTLDALDALSAHAAAASERQAAIAAEQAAPAPAPVEEEQEQRAPAPRPQRPAPPAQPAPTTEPTPSDPGVGDGGDAPVDPEVP